MIELTGVYDFMLPLLVTCFAAYGVAEALGAPPIYEELRLRAKGRLREAAG
jgi:CIC family chloride channel protein